MKSLLESNSFPKHFGNRYLFLIAKLTEIEYRSPRDIRTQIYEMLFHWRSDAAFTARYEKLCEVLVEEGRTATAGKICHF